MVARCPRTTILTALLLCGFTRNSTLESVRLVMTRHYTKSDIHGPSLFVDPAVYRGYICVPFASVFVCLWDGGFDRQRFDPRLGTHLLARSCAQTTGARRRPPLTVVEMLWCARGRCEAVNSTWPRKTLLCSATQTRTTPASW